MGYGFTSWMKIDEFEQIDYETFKVGENIYKTKSNEYDPEYLVDEVMGKASYYSLYDENGNESNYKVVYPLIEQEEGCGPQEWDEIYDTENCFVVKIV